MSFPINQGISFKENIINFLQFSERQTLDCLAFEQINNSTLSYKKWMALNIFLADSMGLFKKLANGLDLDKEFEWQQIELLHKQSNSRAHSCFESIIKEKFMQRLAPDILPKSASRSASETDPNTTTVITQTPTPSNTYGALQKDFSSSNFGDDLESTTSSSYNSAASQLSPIHSELNLNVSEASKSLVLNSNSPPRPVLHKNKTWNSIRKPTARSNSRLAALGVVLPKLANSNAKDDSEKPFSPKRLMTFFSSSNNLFAQDRTGIVTNSKDKDDTIEEMDEDEDFYENDIDEKTPVRIYVDDALAEVEKEQLLLNVEENERSDSISEKTMKTSFRRSKSESALNALTVLERHGTSSYREFEELKFSEIDRSKIVQTAVKNETKTEGNADDDVEVESLHSDDVHSPTDSKKHHDSVWFKKKSERNRALGLAFQMPRSEIEDEYQDELEETLNVIMKSPVFRDRTTVMDSPLSDVFDFSLEKKPVCVGSSPVRGAEKELPPVPLAKPSSVRTQPYSPTTSRITTPKLQIKKPTIMVPEKSPSFMKKVLNSPTLQKFSSKFDLEFDKNNKSTPTTPNNQVLQVKRVSETLSEVHEDPRDFVQDLNRMRLEQVAEEDQEEGDDFDDEFDDDFEEVKPSNSSDSKRSYKTVAANTDSLPRSSGSEQLESAAKEVQESVEGEKKTAETTPEKPEDSEFGDDVEVFEARDMKQVRVVSAGTLNGLISANNSDAAVGYGQSFASTEKLIKAPEATPEKIADQQIPVVSAVPDPAHPAIRALGFEKLNFTENWAQATIPKHLSLKLQDLMEEIKQEHDILISTETQSALEHKLNHLDDISSSASIIAGEFLRGFKRDSVAGSIRDIISNYKRDTMVPQPSPSQLPLSQLHVQSPVKFEPNETINETMNDVTAMSSAVTGGGSNAVVLSAPPAAGIAASVTIRNTNKSRVRQRNRQMSSSHVKEPEFGIVKKQQRERSASNQFPAHQTHMKLVFENGDNDAGDDVAFNNSVVPPTAHNNAGHSKKHSHSVSHRAGGVTGGNHTGSPLITYFASNGKTENRFASSRKETELAKKKQLKERLRQIVSISESFGCDEKSCKMILKLSARQDTKTRWNDICGLLAQKQQVKESLVYPLLKPGLFQDFQDNLSSMLFYGPPGNGKKMLARTIIRESKSFHFDLSAEQLVLQKRHGEKLITALFYLCKQLSPAVILIRDINQLFGDMTLRNAFLHQWRKLILHDNNKGQILVIGITENPWALDEGARAFFQSSQFIPMADYETRKELLKRHVWKRNNNTKLQDSDYRLLATMTKGYTAAEVINVVREASMGPVRELEDVLDTRSVRGIEMRDFNGALQVITRSVSKESVERYEQF